MDMFDKTYEVVTVAFSATLAWVWKHTTGRITRLEDRLVGKEEFRQHMADEVTKFDALFHKHDRTMEVVSDVRTAVSRIEGVLSRMNGNGHDH